MISVWNIRGFNAPVHVQEARRFIRSNRLSVICLLETKVRATSESQVQQSFMPSWQFEIVRYDNAVSRMWLCWNPTEMEVEILNVDVQWIHSRIRFISTNISCCSTFVYGLYEPIDRRLLWNFLRSSAIVLRDVPWCVLGDFNAIRSPHER